MLYDNTTDLGILFGGIHWKPTDLDTTDSRRNVDRRCFKEAQELTEKWTGSTASQPWNEQSFLDYITKRCGEGQFCCQLAELNEGEGLIFGGLYIRPYPRGALCLRNVS